MSCEITTDYCVVGAGAVGMAFADTLVRHSPATVTLIDRQPLPGGHWNHAYPFVRLHLPSHFYGSESLGLGNTSQIVGGHNDGLLHMARGSEIKAYYHRLLDDVLQPTGRVEFLGMHVWDGDRTATSLSTGQRWTMPVRTKVVDATYLPSPVPATHARGFRVADGITCVPVNDLPAVTTPAARYCVIGSGKTGMDACLWLLAQGIAPDRIRWIMPRDAWWIDRAPLQWGDDFIPPLLAFMTGQMEALATAPTVDGLFLEFERRGIALRFDPERLPTMYHNATITRSEQEELRRIGDVVRLGRVTAIEHGRLVLQRGEVAAANDCTYVDCSAVGLTAKPQVPVFAGDRITLQYVRLLRPCLSASIIGWLEAHLPSDDAKNALAEPVPGPGVPDDWVRMTAISLRNQGKAAALPDMMAWLAGNRLDPGTRLLGRAAGDPAHAAAMARLRAAQQAAVAALPRMLATLDGQPA